MDAEKIRQGVRLLLEGIGEDPEREGLRDTPDRVPPVSITFCHFSERYTSPIFRTAG